MEEESTLYALKECILAQHICQVSELESVSSRGFATLIDL